MSYPDLIYRMIPIGSKKALVLLKDIERIDSSSKTDFESLIWGLLLMGVGLAQILLFHQLFLGILLVLVGLLTVVSSFQMILTFETNSGEKLPLPAVIFEKNSLLACQHAIEQKLELLARTESFA
ncbi:hypothetical protein [Streptococcus pacificus]|uniref:Uncharacterized protein n=1 Tax=Streptococcus pacificus TaxID=2740577 RepID=A0ABS0ZIN5_9STRE|nr:hypothetical protein [Streptococcus pacificus]MBJ8325847.1 hypothetical protein [Streptococcus pacificus]